MARLPHTEPQGHRLLPDDIQAPLLLQTRRKTTLQVSSYIIYLFTKEFLEQIR